MDYEKLTTTLRQLAIKGGQAIMEIYGQADFKVMSKSDDSPVTAADLAADRIISEGLRAAFPDIALVTEEQAASHAQRAETFLIVDPLDGTKEFVNRRGDFTVNIAYVEGGTPRRGVVYAPARGRLFITDAAGDSWEESGAFDLESPGEMTRLRAREADNAALEIVASKSHRDAATDAYIARYNSAGLRSAGSSLKFCLVATGEADLYPRLGRTMEWDTAAGHAVLNGAGGTVLHFDTLAPLTYGKADFANPFFIAHGPGVEIKAE